MDGHGTKTLIINPGSATVKFRLYSDRNVLLDGIIDGIGKTSDIHISFHDASVTGTKHIKNYRDAAQFILDFIEDSYSGIGIDKIAYRVVHGGDYKDHVVITPIILKRLRAISRLAPLHNPPALEMIEHLIRKMPHARHIACFDTAFHRTMPPVARTYAIPARVSKKYDIQRYGFHGLAHQYMAQQAKKYSRVITCQLGNGVSVCAVKNGKSIDTSMGFTPLEGLVMGTRSGSIDPALVAYLAEKEGKSARQIATMLEKESGLKGLAGESDVRRLLKRKDAAAKLALEMFCYSVRKYIGAYTAVLGGVDCIVFGGGISKSTDMVKKIVAGIKAKVLVVDTDEQAIMFEISKRF